MNNPMIEMQYDFLKDTVEMALAGLFEPNGLETDGLGEAMTYSLMGGGKRIRPVLCLEFARICGGSVMHILPVACAVELLHTYSLIHDDLPCMDNDDERRGRPSAHKQFGETTAVLAGDCLQAEAFRAICSADIGETERFRCCRLLAEAAGLSGICGGQYMDLNTKEPTVQRQKATDLGKTAALMACACAMGAAAAGGKPETIKAAHAFGAALGMAFQCRDDMLDGDGFCALLGEERCRELTEDYTQEALSCLDAFEETEFLRVLTEELAGRTE